MHERMIDEKKTKIMDCEKDKKQEDDPFCEFYILIW